MARSKPGCRTGQLAGWSKTYDAGVTPESTGTNLARRWAWDCRAVSELVRSELPGSPRRLRLQMWRQVLLHGRRRGGYNHADVEPRRLPTPMYCASCTLFELGRRAVVDYGAAAAASITLSHGGSKASGNNFPGHLYHFLAEPCSGRTRPTIRPWLRKRLDSS